MLVKDKIRWTTAAFFFFSGIITATWSSRIPDIQRQLHLSNGELGAVLFGMSAGLVCALPLSSWLIAKFSSEKIMTISTVLFSIVLALLPFASSVYILLFLLFLFGALRNMVSMSANTNSIEVQAYFKRPVIATFHGIWSMACFVGIAVGGIMISKGVTPPWHFATIGFIILLGTFFSKRKDRNKIISSEKKPFFVKPDRYLFLLGLVAFCAMFCESCMFDWSINYFDKVVEADKDFITFGYSSFIIMMTSGRLVGDRFIARFGTINIMCFNGFLITAGIILVISFPYVLPASIGFGFIGLGSSIVVPIVYSLAGKSTKMSAGYGIAAVTMVGYLGFLTSPLVMGALSERFGMQSAFGILIVISLAISFIAIGLIKNWWLPEQPGHQAK